MNIDKKVHLLRVPMHIWEIIEIISEHYPLKNAPTVAREMLLAGIEQAKKDNIRTFEQFEVPSNATMKLEDYEAQEVASDSHTKAEASPSEAGKSTTGPDISRGIIYSTIYDRYIIDSEKDCWMDTVGFYKWLRDDIDITERREWVIKCFMGQRDTDDAEVTKLSKEVKRYFDTREEVFKNLVNTNQIILGEEV